MHNNYHFLKVLSKQLREELIGYKIGEVFSQSKNELIISFYQREKQAFLKAHLSPEFCCLSFPETFKRARRNSVDLFQEVIDRNVDEIVQIENDRSFFIEIEGDYRMLFKMHGNRSNIILLHKQKATELFKSNLKQDKNIQIDSLKKTVVLNAKELEKHEGDYKKLVPTLGKAFQPYFKTKNYSQVALSDQFQILKELLDYLQDPHFYLHFDSAGLPQLSLVRLDENDVRYDSPKKILNEFFSSYISNTTLQKGKSKLRNSINLQIKKIDAYIKNTTDKLHRLQHTASYQHVGDLIMANLHEIKPFISECLLIDFYTQEKIKVALKKNLSPQANAENYYRKAKKQKIELETLSTNIEAKKRQKKDLMDELAALELSKDLKRFQKESKVLTKAISAPYRMVAIMGHEVLIGKNAAKNELLTFKIAKKDDLFLHAKDAAGSHVIVRKKGNQNFPKLVIEQAASIAAFYSKNKNESLCSVLYTPKKYVRKAKGAPPGSVIVEKEKVILAKPKSLSEF